MTAGNDYSFKLKDAYSLEKICDQPRHHIKKQRHYFANKGPSNHSCVCFH